MAGNDDLPDIIPLGPSADLGKDYREVFDPDTGMTVRVPIGGLASRRPARTGADANVTDFGTALGDAFVRSWQGETQADLAGDLAAILSKREQISKLQPLSLDETLELSKLTTSTPTPVMPSGPYMNFNSPSFQAQARIGELRARQNRDAMLAQLNADLEAKTAELKDVNDILARHQGTTFGKTQFDKAQGFGSSLRAVANNPLDVLSQLAAESSWGSAKAAGAGMAATAATVATGGGALLAGAAGLGATGLLTGMDSYDGKLLEELIKKNPEVIKDPKGYVEAYKKNPADYEKAYREAQKLAIKVGIAEGGATAAMGGLTKLIPGGKTLTGKIASELAGEVSEEVVTAQAVNAAENKGLLSPADAFKAGVGAIAGVGTQGPIMAGVGKAGGAIADAFKPSMQVDAGTLTPMAPRPFSMMPQSGPSQMAVDLNTLTPTTPVQVGPQPQLFVNPSSLTPAGPAPDIIPLGSPQAGAQQAGADAGALPDIIPLSPPTAQPVAASRNDQSQPAQQAQPAQPTQPRVNPLAPVSAPQGGGAGEPVQANTNVVPREKMRAPRAGFRFIEVDPRLVNDEHQRTSPGQSLRTPGNELSRGGVTRTQLAKDYIQQGKFDGAEAAEVAIADDGKLFFNNGRHRLLAAEQLGAPTATIQVPEAQADELSRRFAPRSQAGVASAFQPQATQPTAPTRGQQPQAAPIQAQGQRPVSLAPVNNTNVTNPQVGMPSARPMSVRDQAAWDALAKKGAELDRRRAERRAKFEKDTDPATRRRGNEQVAQSLVNGLRRGGNISHQEATAALRIVERLMERGYLDNLAVSVSDADRGGGVRGEYNEVAELLKLFVRNNERPGILRRTFAHEVSHHLERMIPAKDLEAARQQFLRDRDKWLKDKQGLRQLLGDGNWLDKSFTNEQIKQFLASNTMNPALISQYFIRDTKNGNWRIKLTDETYQFTNFSEYFAEKVAGIAVGRDDARYNPQSGPGVWAKIKDMLAEIKKALMDVFGKDKVEAIWDRFQEGEYTSDFKRDKLQGYDKTGGQNPVMDDPRTADYRNPRFGDADKDRQERVNRIDKLEPNKVLSAEDQSKIDDMRFAGESILEESAGEEESTIAARRDEQVSMANVEKDAKKSGKIAGATLYISSRMLEGMSFDEAFGEVVSKYGKSFSKFRDVVQQTTDRISGLPVSEAFDEAEKLASTRYPMAVGALEDPNKRNLISGLATILADPEKTKKSARELRKITGFKSDKSWDDQRVIREFIKHVEGNLDWLYKGMRDRLPEGILDRSKLWYVGANAIANRLAKKHSIPVEAAAGVLAVLSPQMDWYKNVSLAERALEIVVNKKNHVVDNAMVEAILKRPSMVKLFMAIHEAKIYGDKFEQKKTKWPNKGDFKRDSEAAKALQEKLMAKAVPILRKSGVIPVGTKMGEIKDARLYAYLLRAYDEAYNPREYAVITPEGGTAGMSMNEENTKMNDIGWGNFDIIEKVRPLVENPTMENISRLMGGEHKVRNFYNNIIDPNAELGQVTIDTHAVAAALLEPLAGSDKEVDDNLGATGGSDYTGLSGLYPIYAQAYQNAAKKYGLLPREMQSITWEGVRGLFTNKFKNATNKATIRGHWADYASGKISLATARSRIEKTAGGFKPPTWYGRDGQGSEGLGATQDQGNVDPRGVREGRGRPGPGRAGKGPQGPSVRSARDEGNYHAGQADAKREQLRRLMATMERLEKERDRAEGRDGGPGESNFVKLTKARDDVKDIYKRIDALKKSIGDDEYFSGQNAQSARDDGENTPIPGGYREAFFKAKEGAGAPEPKQIKWWTEVGHDTSADTSKQFLWAIDARGELKITSIEDLHEKLGGTPFDSEDSNGQGPTHLDWADDESSERGLLDGPAHGRVDATGDIVRISMVQKGQNDPAMKADMRDYVKSKLAEAVGVEPFDVRGYDFTDAGPFNEGPTVFSARDEEGPQVPRPSRPGSFKAFDEMVTSREITKPEDMPYPYQMNRFTVLSPASKTARSNLEGYHLVQQGSDNGPQGRNERREFRAVSKEVDPISGKHPTYRILFQFAQSGSRGSKGSVFVTTADDVSDPPDHVKIGLISELFERTRQAGLKDITIDKRYIGEMSPEDIGLWGHVAKNEPEISFDGDLNTYDIDKNTAYSARDDDGENTVIPGGNREAFFNMKAGVPEPKRIKYYTDIGHPTEGQDKNKFFLWAIDGRGKLRVRSVAEVEQMVKETGKDPWAFFSDEDEVVHGDWIHNSSETGKDGYDLRDTQTMGRIDASGDIIRISYATRGVEGEPAEIDVEARDNAKKLLADYLRKEPEDVRGYDFTRTMETGEDPTAFSARDEEPAGPEFTTPGGELANHGDQGLADRGFITRRAFESLPSDLRDRLSIEIDNGDTTDANYGKGKLKLDGKQVGEFEYHDATGDGNITLDWVNVDKKLRGNQLGSVIVAEIGERAKRGEAESMSAAVVDPKERPISSFKSNFGNVREEDVEVSPTDGRDQFRQRDEEGNWVRVAKVVSSDIPQYTPEQRQLIKDMEAARAAGDMAKARRLKAQFDQSVQDNGTQILSARDEESVPNVTGGNDRLNGHVGGFETDAYHASLRKTPSFGNQNGKIYLALDADSGIRQFGPNVHKLKIRSQNPINLLVGKDNKLSDDALDFLKKFYDAELKGTRDEGGRRISFKDLVFGVQYGELFNAHDTAQGDLEYFALDNGYDAVVMLDRSSSSSPVIVTQPANVAKSKGDTARSARDEDYEPQQITGTGESGREEYPVDTRMRMTNRTGHTAFEGDDVNLLESTLSPERRRELQEFVKDSAVKFPVYRGQDPHGGSAYETIDENSMRDGFFHVSTDPEYAAQYAGKAGKLSPDQQSSSGAVVKGYINVKNVLDIRDFGARMDMGDGPMFDELTYAFGRAAKKATGVDARSAARELSDALYENNTSDLSVFELFYEPQVRALLKKYGIDAVRYLDSTGFNSDGVDSFAIMDRSKFKSTYGPNRVDAGSDNMFQSARDEDTPSTGATARKAGLAAGALALAPTTVEAATGAAKAAGATIAGVAVGDLISVASGIAFTSSDRLLKGLNPIVANMHLLANDTRSKTMKRVAEMFNRLGGNTDAGAQETYHEERDANRRIFRNKLADAFEPLARLSQDQIRALDITIARALAGEIPMPSGPVGQVVQNLQALSDELYTYLRQSGLELNYAQGYAIPHSFNAEAVAKDEQAFIDTAEQAYIDNNPKRIRSLQKYIQQIDQEAAQNGGFTQEMTDRKNAMLEEIKKLQVANPRQQAEDLAAAILSGAEGGDQSQGLILASNPRNQNRADFLKSRVFEHSARAMLREYFHNDPRHAWNNYIARATTLAEFSRRFGADGQTWNSMVEQMRKEGVKEVDITRIKEMVLDAMGALTPAAQGSHAMANALLGLSNMSKLKSTFLTNFLEAQAQAIPGNLLDTITAPVVMLKEFAAILAELSPRQRALLKQFLRVDLNSETGNMELARITGLMDSAGVHNIMENSAYALDNKADFREDSRTDRAARKISNATGRMAQAYGIEASENAKRAMGARYAAGRLDQHVSEFLRDNILARALKKVGYKGDAMTTRNEAIMRLRRAGVNDANMIAFGTWWEKARLSGKFNEMLADTTDPMAAMARKAIRMESARAMVNSNRAMKPGGERNKAISQDNFWGKAVMSFLNYPAAFREQIAKPMARDIASGFKGYESEGGQSTFFSPAERARMIARASAIPAMAVSAAAFLALRVLALGDEEDKEELKKKTLLNHMIDGLSYTGLTGGKTEAVQRARRGQLPPIIDEGVRLGKNFEREATKSNGKERAITKSLTRSVAVPGTQAVVSTYAPAPIAAVVDQALASKAFNELVVDTVAGKEKEKKKASSDPRTGSRESGRSSGRSDGR